MYLFYGSYLGGYATLIKSAETAFVVMLGKFDSSQYLQQNTYIGPFIFSAYNIVMICFILNIFISIITDSFEKIRLNSKENPNRNLQFWSHLKKKLKSLFKRNDQQVSLQRKRKYRDYISVFPKRIDYLVNYVTRVSISFYYES